MSKKKTECSTPFHERTAKAKEDLERIVVKDLEAVKTRGDEGINLDLYAPDCLMAFWSLVRNRRSWVQQVIFPNRIYGQDAIELRDAVDDLSAYAVARASMLNCVEEGREKSALVYGAHCRIYYSNLPEWAQFREEKAEVEGSNE